MSGYLLSPKLVSDPSLDCFATLPNCMVGGEAQPIPFANFGRRDVRIYNGQLLGHLEASPVKARETSVYLNLHDIFTHGMPPEKNDDSVDSLPYLADYPVDHSNDSTRPDVSTYWGTEYQTRLKNILQKHHRLF